MKSELGWMLVEKQGNLSFLFPDKRINKDEAVDMRLVAKTGAHVKAPDYAIEQPQSCHFLWPTLVDAVNADGGILERGDVVRVEGFYDEKKKHARYEGHFVPDEVIVLYAVNDRIAVNGKGQ